MLVKLVGVGSVQIKRNKRKSGGGGGATFHWLNMYDHTVAVHCDDHYINYYTGLNFEEFTKQTSNQLC